MKVEKIKLINNKTGIESGSVSKIERAKLPETKADTVTLSSQPAFTGKLPPILKNLPGYKSLEKFSKVDWLQGEVGGIILTALGTGLVAPLSIAFNPFMKAPKNATPEEKQKVTDTKVYSAWRQPISAAVALICQLSIQKWIDKFLDNMVNIEKCAKNHSIFCDRSELNTNSYLERNAEKWLAAKGIKKPFLLSSKRQKYKVIVEAKAKDIGNQQVDNLAENFQKTGSIKVGDRTLDNKTLSKLINEQIENYISNAESLQIDDNGRVLYAKRAETLVNHEAHLKEIFKDAERFGDSPQGYKELDKYLKDLLKNETSDDVKILIKEVLDLPEDMRASRMDNTLKRIERIHEICGEKGFTRANYIDTMLERNKTLQRIKTKLGIIKAENIPEKASNKSIISTINKVKEACRFDNKFLESILHDTDTFNKNGEVLLKKIYKDVTKGYKSLIDHKFKSYSQITKIGAGVFTMILSCDLLNWIYPRFMDLVFPRLSGVKKAQENGGDK